MDKNQLIITALQQRIGEMSAAYELQIAMLRAEMTSMIEEKNKKTSNEYERQGALEDYSDSIREKIEEV